MDDDQKAFALEYVYGGECDWSAEQWGWRFGVTPAVIRRWLRTPVVKQLIQQYRDERVERYESYCREGWYRRFVMSVFSDVANAAPRKVRRSAVMAGVVTGRMRQWIPDAPPGASAFPPIELPDDKLVRQLRKVQAFDTSEDLHGGRAIRKRVHASGKSGRGG